MSKSGYSGKNGKHELLPHNMVSPWSVADVAGNGTSCPVGDQALMKRNDALDEPLAGVAGSRCLTAAQAQLA
ncbi:hypothetical protein Q9966_000195 [Columba livia]|nr:hypothetical protein Q9966_000195 [Columba livia]